MCPSLLFGMITEERMRLLLTCDGKQERSVDFRLREKWRMLS